MADFYEVWSCRGSVLEKLNAMLEAREAARDQELKAATDIKRVYRGKVKMIVDVFNATRVKIRESFLSLGTAACLLTSIYLSRELTRLWSYTRLFALDYECTAGLVPSREKEHTAVHCTGAF